jgi:molybdopterin molybdotransferase
MLAGMLRIGEALRLLVPCFAPREVERRPPYAALGRALAQDVLAPIDLPRFDDSAMDGYAVRFDDLGSAVALALHGESRAGGGDPGALPEGRAMRIFTGAPLPRGADTVVIQEDARVGDGGSSVTFAATPVRGANVRKRASDVREGARVLSAGSAIGPREAALLSALGCTEVAVPRAPRVAIMSVGDELREPGEPLSPFDVVNTNAHYLETQVRALGAEPVRMRIARDDLADIGAVLEPALQADVVLSSAGVSVGDYDHVAQAYARAGVERRFAKVAIKPGKPLWLGMRGAVPVLGLPGNPVSTMVTFEVFAKPALRHMLGHAAPYPSLVSVTLAHEHRHGQGRPELARGTLSVDAQGELRVHLHARQGSGSLPSMAAADALVLLDAEIAQWPAGARLRALLLHGGPCQAEPAFE